MDHAKLNFYIYASTKEGHLPNSAFLSRGKFFRVKWALQPSKLRLGRKTVRACNSERRSFVEKGKQKQEEDMGCPSLGLKPLVVIGSANADIYVEVERLPAPGETLAAATGCTLPGGKGANQAACAARLSYPTFFIGQVGEDAHGGLIRDALTTCGVHLEHLKSVPVPTGHAVVMLQPGGQNSIIIVGGANISWQRLEDTVSHFSVSTRQVICQAGAILLQREITDAVNVEAAMIAKNAKVPVILDVGGADTPIPESLLQCVTVLSPNETELARLTGAPVNSLEDAIGAARQCQKMGVQQVLIKLGERGSVLLTEDGNTTVQPTIRAPIVLDTTGAGDTFTAAYAVALVEGQSLANSLQFANSELFHLTRLEISRTYHFAKQSRTRDFGGSFCTLDYMSAYKLLYYKGQGDFMRETSFLYCL